MKSFVGELGAIGQLTRIKEQKRVDELPALMEASPNKAILVEKVIDSEFSFLAGAYSTREQYAHALKGDPRDPGKAISRVNLRREKPVLVERLLARTPRTLEDILKKFHGQPYPNIYRAFGGLRPRLGRVADQRPEYPLTIADSCFVHRGGETPTGQ